MHKAIIKTVIVVVIMIRKCFRSFNRNRNKNKKNTYLLFPLSYPLGIFTIIQCRNKQKKKKQQHFFPFLLFFFLYKIKPVISPAICAFDHCFLSVLVTIHNYRVQLFRDLSQLRMLSIYKLALAIESKVSLSVVHIR